MTDEAVNMRSIRSYRIDLLSKSHLNSDNLQQRSAFGAQRKVPNLHLALGGQSQQRPGRM
jgi:hypothetical protein